MLMALLIAGIVFLLAGLGGVALGIPVKEFSFGNTEILAGVMVACTGAIMISLWVSITELAKLARRAGSAVVAPMPRPPFSLPSALTDPSPYERGMEDNGVLPDLDEVEAEPESEPEPAAAAPPSALPWRQENASRGRRGETPLPEEELPSAPSAIKPRRNLLFTSTRLERERSEARAAESEISGSSPAAPPPPLPFKPLDAAQPASFEDTWSQPDRAKIPDTGPRRMLGRNSFAGAERRPAAADRAMLPPTEEEPGAARDEGSPQVTILKSGIVDGMAYSLYSDGSIEAQMPEGMMRFASIDELRAHLDQRGG
jgi:hypothetical protein